MALAEIPLDVILEITSFLDLHDSFHLLVVSQFADIKQWAQVSYYMTDLLIFSIATLLERFLAEGPG
jgi:hypothetical protein